MNTTDLNSYRVKLMRVFEKLSTPNFVLDTYYADNLLSRLEVDDTEVAKLLESDIIPELLVKFTKLLTGKCDAKIFYVRLLSLVVKNELHFTKLYYTKVLDTMMKCIDLNNPSQKCPLKCHYIKVMTSLLKHPSGLKWILGNDVFMPVYDVCSQKQTVFILRGAYKFLNSFLWKLDEAEDEENLLKALDYILAPITRNNMFNNDGIVPVVESVQFIKAIEPTLDILTLILEETNKILKPNIIFNLLSNHFNITSKLMLMLACVRDEQFLLKLATVIFLMAVSKPEVIVNEETGGSEKIEIPLYYITLIQSFVEKRLLNVAIKFSCSCCCYWSKYFKLDTTKTFQVHGKQFEILNQLVFIALIPVVINEDLIGINDEFSEHPLHQYTMKWLDISCEHSTRLAYSIRELVLEINDKNTARTALKYFSNIFPHLTQPLANSIYQGLHHLLCLYVPIEELAFRPKANFPKAKYNFVENMDFVMQILQAIYLLIKSYNISWHESYEAIFLYSSINSTLKLPNASTNFTIVALKLLNLCISKFLQPNMALLVESDKGSPIEELGSILHAKMNDLNWEIRDSALEVLLTCTELAFIKYTPFQKVILSNRLMTLAATLAINDNELYVKTAAVRCLTAATKIESVWNSVLTAIPDITCQVVAIIVKNEEGVVRKECMLHYRELFIQQKLPVACKQRLYKLVTHVTIDDLNHEVQVGGLTFWQVVIQDLLKREGMIDGCFPPVTFSKESKKIVNLNEYEIRKRLVKVLNELARIGCLKCLHDSVKEDCEVSVIAKSVEVANELINMLTRHGVTSVEEDEVLMMNDSTSVDFHIKLPQSEPMELSETCVDTVINDILESSDLNLLATMTIDQNNISSQSGVFLDERPLAYYYLSPNKFLQKFLNKHFDRIIEEKGKWKAGIRSIHSLLDDITGCYNMEDVNDLDCY